MMIEMEKSDILATLRELNEHGLQKLGGALDTARIFSHHNADPPLRKPGGSLDTASTARHK